jgi:hypothetical protein
MKSEALKNIIEIEEFWAWLSGEERERWGEDQKCERTYHLAWARHEAIHKLCESIRSNNADLLKEIEAIQRDIGFAMMGLRASDYSNWAVSRGRAIHSYIMPEMDTQTKMMLDAIKTT